MTDVWAFVCADRGSAVWRHPRAMSSDHVSCLGSGVCALALSSLRELKEMVNSRGGYNVSRIHASVRVAAGAALFVGLIMPAWPAAGQQPETVATLSFTEGPTVDGAGNVYFTDIINQRILKLSADGVLSTYREHSNLANGLL